MKNIAKYLDNKQAIGSFFIDLTKSLGSLYPHILLHTLFNHGIWVVLLIPYLKTTYLKGRNIILCFYNKHFFGFCFD